MMFGGFGLLVSEGSAVVSGGDSLTNLLLYVSDPFPSFTGTFTVFRWIVYRHGKCNVITVVAVLVFLFFTFIFRW